MQYWRRISQSVVALMLLMVVACATNNDEYVVYSGTPVEQEPDTVEPVIPEQSNFTRLRILADMLYEARLAYEDNRLTSPAGYNAYDIYLQVLEVDEGNAVALEGIVQIARRYIELADAAMVQNQYDQAENYLDRSSSLIPDEPGLQAARERLAIARQNRVTTFALDPIGLSSRTDAMVALLGQIAGHIRRQEAVFLINARNDEEGRWIYQVMREAVNGFRLRGNIDISATPRIMVTVPQNNQP